MSKTFEELRSDYNRGFWSVPETDGLQAQQNAGIAAVIMAVRGVIDQAYSEGRASKVRGDNENVQRQWVDALINEILGDAGNEKVAEGPLPHLSEREKALFVAALKGDAGPITPPAAAPAPVCEWAWERPSATSYYGWYRTSHGERTCNFSLGGKCSACGLPIKFTEANT